MNKAIKCLTINYANFSGRASRSEYWYFFLFSLLVGFVVGFVSGIIGMIADKQVISMFTAIFNLAWLIPSLSVAVRRLHDLGKSGWWLLIAFVPIIGAIYLIVLYCSRGTDGSNRFGDDPLRA